MNSGEPVPNRKCNFDVTLEDLVRDDLHIHVARLRKNAIHDLLNVRLDTAGTRKRLCAEGVVHFDGVPYLCESRVELALAEQEIAVSPGNLRSEERRVGKGCRARWYV